MENEVIDITGLSEKDMTPSEYFDAIKTRKHTITDADLVRIYDNALQMLNKYKATGQKKGAKRLIFHLETIEKERQIVKLGINTFVYKDDIEYYIKNVASDVVKIIDLESYEREIPDDIVELIAQTKGFFDQLYVVFTDYTGETERQVEAERREKDPILFGAFKSSRAIIDRFYYLGDWVDEYCDLTLDKMIDECGKMGKRNIVHTIKTPEDIAEFKAQLDKYDGLTLTTSSNLVINEEKKPTLGTKIKRFFKS